MEEVLKDPLWPVIGVVFAVLAVLVTIIIFFVQRKTKKLSFEITSNTQLLGVKDEIQGKVQVLYEGKEVKNVHLLTVKITNSGNQSISSSDYERPLSIEVSSESKILTHEVVDQEPTNLGVSIDVRENEIIVAPTLLNEKDSFSIKALVSDFDGKANIDGRINGVKSITQFKEGHMSFMILTLTALVLIGFGAPNLDKKELISILGFDISRSVIGGVLFGLGYIAMLSAIIRNKRMSFLFKEFVRAFIFR